MRKRLGQGLELALRSEAAPLVFGLRWLDGRRAEATDVPPPGRSARLWAKVALDEIFFATEVVSAVLISLEEHGRLVRELDAALELYEERGWLEDPTGFHGDPPPVVEATLQDVRASWGTWRHLRFESGYEPHPGEPGRERWLDQPENRTAHAWLLEHSGPERPWLVCVPGYRMGHPAVDFTGFRARWLHETLGLNVAIPVLPLHGPRRVGRRGGDGFLTGNFVDTVHAQAQAVWDVRRLVEWLGRQGAPALGLYGVSLGGYTTALLATLEAELACVIAGIPAADFLRLVRTHTPSFLLATAERLGLRFERIGRLLRVISPLALPPRVPLERRYLYAGTSDRLASPDHARDLWQHWGRPRLAWYQGGHVSFLWEREVRELLLEALGASGLLPRSGETGR